MQNIQIENIMENKNILMIPVYSARSYDDSKYDLMVDGNISKYLMKIFKSNANTIDIFYPDNSINFENVKRYCKMYKKCEVNWLPVKYGKNALETRNMGDIFLEYIMQIPKKYDLIIFEINTLPRILIADKERKHIFFQKYTFDNLLYWMGTHNENGTLWNASNNNDTMNSIIPQYISTACLLFEQVGFYKRKCFYDYYEYDPSYFDKKVIFIPFRLSDKSYDIEYIISILEKIKQYKEFTVLYTDPNDSHLFDNLDANIYIKIPKQKDVYCSILKGKPIIIYLDDLSVNSHSNIFDFLYYGCELIMYKKKSDLFTYDIDNADVTFIENKEELQKILEEKLYNL